MNEQLLEDVPDTSGARRALEALVVENPELEHLESLLDPFNVFEALGAVTQEVRHSDFLAFLLNPQQNHGLGDAFVKRFLQRALQVKAMLPSRLSSIDIDVWDLGGLEVRREWQGIDILLLVRDHNFAVIIENKLYSGEHSNQLARYWTTIQEQLPGFAIVGIFLTLDENLPSDERYIPIGYASVGSLVEALAESRSATLGAEVRSLMLHYVQMLRRHFLADTDIADLARRIYQKHQRALDLIFEFRPDRQAQVKEMLTELISSTPGLVADFSSKVYVRFSLSRWDSSEILRQGQGWTRSGRLLLFEIVNEPSRVVLKLIIGPGPQNTRQRLFNAAKERQPPFRPSQSMLGRMWNTIFQRQLLAGRNLEDQEIESVRENLRKEWDQFVKTALPGIAAALDDEEWLWQSSASTKIEEKPV